MPPIDMQMTVLDSCSKPIIKWVYNQDDLCGKVCDMITILSTWASYWDATTTTTTTDKYIMNILEIITFILCGHVLKMFHRNISNIWWSTCRADDNFMDRTGVRWADILDLRDNYPSGLIAAVTQGRHEGRTHSLMSGAVLELLRHIRWKLSCFVFTLFCLFRRRLGSLVGLLLAAWVAPLPTFRRCHTVELCFVTKLSIAVILSLGKLSTLFGRNYVLMLELIK